MLNRESPEGKEIRRLAALAKSKVKLYRRNVVYRLPVWLQNPSTDAAVGFTRQGDK